MKHEHRDEAAVTPGPALDGVSRDAARRCRGAAAPLQRAGDRADVSRCDLDRERRLQRGIGSEQPPRVGVDDASLLRESADDPDDAETRLGPVLELRREQRAGVQVERLCEPEADLRFAGAAQTLSFRERRRLKFSVIAAECDDLERLAEVERIGRERVVPRRRRDDASHAAHLREIRRRRVDGELVRAADRLRLCLQA